MGNNPSMAYVVALIISILSLLIAAGITYAIPNRPGGSDIKTSKVWFYIFMIVTLVLSLVINIYTASTIKIPTRHDAYLSASLWAGGVSVLFYFVVGLLLSKGMSRGKLGRWF